jgi:drug/metabolite transporter (DMT)-like permease
MVWGATFVLTQTAVSAYPVFSFLAWRFLIATLTFGLLFARPLTRACAALDRSTITIAIVAGILLSLGYIFQTYGLIPGEAGGTTPARTAFITGLFVIWVPLGQFLLSRKPLARGVVVGIVLALTGLWFLSGLALKSTGFMWVRGDTMVLLCSLAYAAHILVLGRLDDSHETVLLVFVQLAVVMLVCAVMAVLRSNTLGIPSDPTVRYAIVICGVFASAYAFAIQTWAQQIMAPARVALILVMEPAFGGLFGWIAQGFVQVHELIGALFMMSAFFLAELQPKSDNGRPG